MNILELLSKELENKDWDLQEKTRYLYLRSCELFSYDERYDFYDITLNDIEKLQEIRNKKINLQNLEDNRVICTTYTREVIYKIMRELLNIECIEQGTSHIWTTFNDGKRIINADATISSDLARVKMGLTTVGYRTAMNIYSFKDDIKRIDKKIGYIDEEYENFSLEQRIDGLFFEFLEYANIDTLENNDEFLIYKLYVIKELFEKYKKLNGFSDSEFCISYLIKKMLVKDLKKEETVSLFDLSYDEKWNFINIYPFKLSDQMLYFILHKIDGSYCFYEISESDAKNYVKTLQGINRNLIQF